MAVSFEAPLVAHVDPTRRVSHPIAPGVYWTKVSVDSWGSVRTTSGRCHWSRALAEEDAGYVRWKAHLPVRRPC